MYRDTIFILSESRFTGNLVYRYIVAPLAYNRLSDFFWICHKTIEYLNLKFLLLLVLEDLSYKKIRIFEILNFRLSIDFLSDVLNFIYSYRLGVIR